MNIVMLRSTILTYDNTIAIIFYSRIMLLKISEVIYFVCLLLNHQFCLKVYFM